MAVQRGLLAERNKKNNHISFPAAQKSSATMSIVLLLWRARITTIGREQVWKESSARIKGTVARDFSGRGTGSERGRGVSGRSW